MRSAVGRHQDGQGLREDANERLHARRRRLVRRQLALEAEKVQENKQKNVCAELIQALFRGIVARKYAAFLRRLRTAATRIQQMARSHAARKEFRRLLRIKYRVVPTKYQLKDLLDRSVRERVEDCWSEWRDKATGQLFYVEMGTGESQWAAPEVFQPLMVCEWQKCGRTFATANQLQDHQQQDHYWTCYACREDNDITTYPVCPKCGNQLDDEGRTMAQQARDKGWEQDLQRLAQKRRDLLAAHRARQVASVPSGEDVERLKSKAWLRRVKSRGEGMARGIELRDGERALGTRPGSSFRESLQAHRPPGSRATTSTRRRSPNRKSKSRRRLRGDKSGAAAPTALPPAQPVINSGGAGVDGVDGAAAGARAGAGAGAGAGGSGDAGAGVGTRDAGPHRRPHTTPAPARQEASSGRQPSVAVVQGAIGCTLDWGDDVRLFASAEAQVGAHAPSDAAPLESAPQSALSVHVGGKSKPGAGSGVAAVRAMSPARSVRFDMAPSTATPVLSQPTPPAQPEVDADTPPTSARSHAVDGAGSGRVVRASTAPARPDYSAPAFVPPPLLSVEDVEVVAKYPPVRRLNTALELLLPRVRCARVATATIVCVYVCVLTHHTLDVLSYTTLDFVLQASKELQQAQQRWRKALDESRFEDTKRLKVLCDDRQRVKHAVEGVVYSARKELRLSAAKAVESYRSLIKNGRSVRAYQGGAVFTGSVVRAFAAVLVSSC